MFPVLLDISESIKIYAFGTFIVLAFLVASTYVRRRAVRLLGSDREQVLNLCFALLFIGLAGARMMYVMLDYDRFAERPMSLFYIWEGGLVWYGGLFAVMAWLLFALPRKPSLRGWSFVDVLSLGGALSIFVGRWASFLSGENYGKLAPDLSWAVTFPPHPYTQVPGSLIGQALHPAQLYHSLHGLVLFGVLLWCTRRRWGPGALSGMFLMLYALGRFVIEYFRGDDAARGMVIDGHLSTSQAISIPVFFVGLAIWMMKRPLPAFSLQDAAPAEA